MCLLYGEIYLLEATKIAQDTKNFCDYEFVGLHQSSNGKIAAHATETKNVIYRSYY